jgi:pimeloyl-ACP methyl ester carboxylesterase
MQNLILLHGALGCQKQLEELRQQLKGYFQVFSFDFQGHGEQKAVKKDFSIALFSTDLISFLDLNNIEKAFVFGYSMGGYVGLYTAKRYPDRFQGIFTLATKFNWNVESAKKEAAMLIPEKIKEKVPHFALELKNRHGEKWEGVLNKTAQMMIEMGSKPPFTLRDAKEIKVRSLISVGDKDRMVSLAETELFQKEIPGSKMFIFPSTAHELEKVDLYLLIKEVINFTGEKEKS